MLQNYSYSNLEAMISSIYSNAEIISKMLKSIKEQESAINAKMKSYASVKKTISEDKIDLYREYVSDKSQMENQLELYSEDLNTDACMKQLSLEIYKSDADYTRIHTAFDRINSIQIKVMELLCSLLCKANRIVATF